VLWPWLGAVSNNISFSSNSSFSMAHWLVYTALLDLSLVAHARTMMTNPGAVPPGSQPTARAILGYLELGCVFDAATPPTRRVIIMDVH
jgi:hypothetical protein